MTPLRLDSDGLPKGYEDVQPGDCLVAFSRATIYEARVKVKEKTGLSSCIVYGALPAETRRAQARKFNDPDSDAKVLIASDAIGMGLNFNIRRVVFLGLEKKHARKTVKVPATLIKQIAGRAGRRNR
jgi:ATP-dependent RNA helicase SUPV3L1/SUV3